MYQSYPGPGSAQEPEHTQPPNSVRNAVKLMYAGAAVEVLGVVVTLLTTSRLKSAILKAHPTYTASQLHNAEVAQATSLAVGAVIAIGLWLWMAWANGQGRNWARIVSAVLFGINTLDLLISFALVRAAANLIVGIVIWLIGLVAIILIFNKESAPYYGKQTSAE